MLGTIFLIVLYVFLIYRLVQMMIIGKGVLFPDFNLITEKFNNGSVVSWKVAYYLIFTLFLVIPAIVLISIFVLS